MKTKNLIKRVFNIPTITTVSNYNFDLLVEPLTTQTTGVRNA